MTPRSGHCVLALPDGSLLATGGYDSVTRFGDVLRIDGDDVEYGQWTSLEVQGALEGRAGHLMAGGVEGTVLVAASLQHFFSEAFLPEVASFVPQ